MNLPDNECLFWVTLALYLGGAALALTATSVLAFRAVRSRRRLRDSIHAGKEAAVRQDARLQAPRPENDTDQQYLTDALQTFGDEFENGVGRRMNAFTYADNLLLPELIALAITEDQIDELKLPALLVAAGVIISTAGSTLSLFL